MVRGKCLFLIFHSQGEDPDRFILDKGCFLPVGLSLIWSGKESSVDERREHESGI